jgi:hypothetical protein
MMLAVGIAAIVAMGVAALNYFSTRAQAPQEDPRAAEEREATRRKLSEEREAARRKLSESEAHPSSTGTTDMSQDERRFDEEKARARELSSARKSDRL